MKNTLLLPLFLGIFTFTFAQDSKNEMDVKYRRSSLYSVMVDQPGLPYASEIKKNFENSPIPDKFNNHNLSKRIYSLGELPLDGAYDAPILNSIARDLVAIWFNRSEKGGFSMNLIKERGFYDATSLDVAKAKASKRSLDLLSDAGEELIGKTFVLINDFKYTDKAEVAEKASGWLNVLGTIGDYAGVSYASTITTAAGAGATVAGKGYIVKANAHLYQLVWDEETAAIFYNDYWADDQTITPAKKKAFEESTIFKLKYVGADTSWSDIQSTIYTSKTDEELIERASVKAIDRVIVKLQKNHDQFKTKTPLYTVEPLTAKIGLKEGLTKKSTFDVLEQVEDENGRTSYAKVGVVKIDNKYPIWDNTYGAEEENPNSTIDRTHFKRSSGKEFFPGMLLVQRNGK
jgi:hypothetical protein